MPWLSQPWHYRRKGRTEILTIKITNKQVLHTQFANILLSYRPNAENSIKKNTLVNTCQALIVLLVLPFWVAQLSCVQQVLYQDSVCRRSLAILLAHTHTHTNAKSIVKLKNFQSRHFALRRVHRMILSFTEYLPIPGMHNSICNQCPTFVGVFGITLHHLK